MDSAARSAVTNRNFQFVGCGNLCQTVRAASTRPAHRPERSLTDCFRNFNPVTRIGALSEGRAEKAALGYGYRSRVNSGQILPHKEIDRLPSGLVPGVSPAPCKAWLSGDADIRPLVPQADHAQLVSVGATIDPRYGWSVNGTEIGNRLTRLHCPSVVALTGEEVLSSE